MKISSKYNPLIAMLALSAATAEKPAAAGNLQRFESQATQANLLELFSSEGCSSCPPADAWLASLRAHPDLWKRFVPIEFHVDYWNRLGWNDRFSKEAFTGRQQQYSREWRTSSVYTPGLVLNGGEWRSGADSAAFAKSSEKKVGVLKASQTTPTKYFITFRPGLEAGSDLKISGALLGNGLVSEVRSGENSGKTLRHEFVVLSLKTQNMDLAAGEYSAVIELKRPEESKAASYSVAFWVSKDGIQKPVQAVGGDLN